MGEILSFPRNNAPKPEVTSPQTLHRLQEFVTRIFIDDDFANRQIAAYQEVVDSAAVPIKRQD